MAGLLSAIGGTLAGIGQGLTEQAAEDGKAKREARLMELQHGYAMERQKDSQQFQTAERVDGQVYQTQRDTTKFGQDKELKGIQHGYDVDLEGRRAGSNQANTTLSHDLQLKRDQAQSDLRIKEKKAESESKGFSLGTNDDKLLNDLRGQYYDSEFDPKDPAIEDKIAARLEGMGRRDLASYVRGRWEKVPIPTDLQPSGPSVNEPGRRSQSQPAPNPVSPSAGASGPQAGTPPSGKGAQPNAAEAIGAARTAITRGAPKDAVIARLRQMGITPPSDL
jgi:hypothetical protein